ncbi:MAG: amidase [Gemmataceae bacterium]|nr:amidase [Gemmataceae bacterium]
MSELPWMGVVELARAIAAKKVSPVEVMRAQLARIEKLDGRFKSYISVFGEQALETARHAEKAATAGQRLGALHGVPVAVKDLYDVQGTPTTAGSRFLKTPAQRDCTAVARLRAAGAIILGKLNMHEFAFGPEGINEHFGTPWNPWDTSTHRMPGGSSSGSGVAVAAGLIPMGMGSDTGGSIRIPSALCNTVGLKPTYGRVSRAGIWPLAWSLDHAGPLTRSVEDAAAVLGVLAGHDPADPSSSGHAVPDYLGQLAAPVRGLRVGLLTEYVAEADPVVQTTVRAAAQVLDGLGCTVEEVKLPLARHGAGASFSILISEAGAFHDPLMRKHGTEYSPDVFRRLLVARFLSAGDYLKGQRARRLIREDVDKVLGRVDCLLTPTLPIAAPPLTATEVDIGDRKESARFALTMFTRLFNVTGHPALAVPCGFTGEGLPLSLQLVGRAFEEATILRLGHAFQQATEWHRHRPTDMG